MTLAILLGRRNPAVLVLWLFLVFPVHAGAQMPAAAQGQNKGLTASVEFDGSLNSSGNFYEIGSSIGYDFGGHFAMDVSMPFYIQPSTNGSASNNQFGDPALGLHFKFPNPTLGYNTNLTGVFPTTGTAHGLSTGRMTYDWSNHFYHAFSALTPFVDAGIANSLLDTRLYRRPYTTLGYNAHFAAGASKDVWKFFTVSASAYDVLPWGPQKIYSRVMGAQSGSPNSNAGKHGRVFETNAMTSGTAAIARDNGYSATLEASPSKYVDMEVGYTRSVHYALNTVSFSLGLNLGQLAKDRSSH